MYRHRKKNHGGTWISKIFCSNNGISHYSLRLVCDAHTYRHVCVCLVYVNRFIVNKTLLFSIIHFLFSVIITICQGVVSKSDDRRWDRALLVETKPSTSEKLSKIDICYS